MSSSKYYTVGITGASGLVGSALIDELIKKSTINNKPVRVVQFSRTSSDNVAESVVDLSDGETSVKALWNPKNDDDVVVIDPDLLSQLDALVHLAGENVATGTGPLGALGIRPWTDEKKQEILSSRADSTAALCRAIAANNNNNNRKQQPMVFMVASGIGAYGDDFVDDSKPAVDESADTSTASGFLAKVSQATESATVPIENNKNVRIVKMRFGVVLSKKGGALAKLYPIFFLGGGGNVGSGSQYFSYIAARDHARALVHTLETPSLQGVVNYCTPEPCTNAEFTKALGSVLGRPTVLPLPAFAVSTLFGEMGQEMLLGGVRVKPSKLLESGFEFTCPDITSSLQSAVDENI